MKLGKKQRAAGGFLSIHDDCHEDIHHLNETAFNLVRRL